MLANAAGGRTGGGVGGDGPWSLPSRRAGVDIGTCGAPAIRTGVELDDADAAFRAELAPVAEANAAAVAAAVAAAAAAADGSADDYEEEEWEEQGLHDYDAMAYDANDLAAGDDDDCVEEEGEAGGAGAAAGRAKGAAAPARRMTGEERAGLKSSHQTHLLCLVARGALAGTCE